MHRTTSKLTPEDVAWLEQQLSRVIEPITPRPEFIHRAKQELMDLPPAAPLPRWARTTVLAALLLSLLALLGAILFLRRND
jgi:hypothetical protein